MKGSQITRREFAGVLAAATVSCGGGDDWVELFDGRSLDGWKAAESESTWKVVDGQLVSDGPRSHLFYAGPVKNADFKKAYDSMVAFRGDDYLWWQVAEYTFDTFQIRARAHG